MSEGLRRGGIPVQGPEIPLTDAAHVRMAIYQWRYYEFPSVEAKREAVRRVLAAAERFGVERSWVEAAFNILERYGEVKTR